MADLNEAELLKLASDLEYVGFSTAEFRGSLVAHGWTVGDVKRALVTYIMMGNNASQAKRVERAANPDKAREMASWLAGKEVKKNAKTGNPITLGRLAKAYAPVVLRLRMLLASKLRTQFPTSSPIEQCDIAFLGYAGTRHCSQSRDYVEKFGLIISKVAFPNMADSEIRLRNEGFARIAEDGLSRDPMMRKLLNADSLGELDPMLLELHVRSPPTPPATRPGGTKA